MHQKIFVISRDLGLKALLLCLLFFFLGVIDPVSGAEKKTPAKPVKIEKIIKKSVRQVITLIGNTEPSMKGTAASEVEGLVTEFPVRAGQTVRAGDLLARVETTLLSLELKQAEAGLAEAEVNYQNILSDLETKEALFKTKAISSRDYDNVRYSANALKQRIAALKVRIEAIHYNLERCAIRAPFAGVVIEEHTQQGEWMRKGGPVVTLINLNPMRIIVPVPDRHIQFIEPGQTVEIDFEYMNPRQRREGRVSHIIPQGNLKARTLPVHVLLDNPGNNILSGTSSLVHFQVGEPYEALLINKDAFSGAGEQDHVFVIRNGKAEQVSVRRGHAYGSLIVTEGVLSDGEMVVVEGNERLRSGQEVRIIENARD